jgi:hypothetical protein
MTNNSLLWVFLGVAFLNACQPLRKFLGQTSPKTGEVSERPLPKDVNVFQLDEGTDELVKNIERALLNGDPETGEVHFTRGQEHELMPIKENVGILRFGYPEPTLVLPKINEWFKAASSGLGVRLSLSLHRYPIAGKSGRVLPGHTPEIVLQGLKLRLENGIRPKTFSIEPQVLSPRTLESENNSPPAALFFSIAETSTRKGLLAEGCHLISSYLSASQLLQGIQPESAIGVELDCNYSLEKPNRMSGEAETETTLRLLNLPFPWKPAAATSFPYKNLENFFEALD